MKEILWEGNKEDDKNQTLIIKETGTPIWRWTKNCWVYLIQIDFREDLEKLNKVWTITRIII